MAKRWVLDTETKGTGAHMVPLEEVAERPAPQRTLTMVEPKAAPRPAEPAPREPRRFKVIDVMTRQVLAEGADARTTLDLLRGLRSMVDVTIYVGQPDTASWRRLTHREKTLMWEARAA